MKITKLFKSHFSGLAVFFLSCILVFACKKDVAPDPVQLIGRWQLWKVVDEGNIIDKRTPYLSRYEVEMEFLPDGKMEGTSSSNPVVGSYQVLSRNSITISHALLSKVGESSWGNYFNDGLPATKTYSLKNDVLILFFEDNRLIFKKVK